MGVPRKQYTSEFKREAVRLVTEGGLSIAQITRDLGFNETMLHRCKKKFEQKQEQAFPGAGHAPQDELSQIRREMEILRREREILKQELVQRETYQSHEQAKARLCGYIEVFYNRKRRHSAPGNLSPHDYEQSLLN